MPIWKIRDRFKRDKEPVDRDERRDERKKRWTGLFGVLFKTLGAGIASKWGWLPALALAALILLKGC